MKKLSNEEFQKKVYELVKIDYVVLDEYINSRTKIRFKHIKCNNIFEMCPTNLLSGRRCAGHRCPICSRK
ncbi:MAG: hypothetical protein K0Q49_2597 [Haloplasmataceae bacterium]|jgi:hypothetical protein|nr:hypothetical protein [Haloplasmataceae bacterium]